MEETINGNFSNLEGNSQLEVKENHGNTTVYSNHIKYDGSPVLS